MGEEKAQLHLSGNGSSTTTGAAIVDYRDHNSRAKPEGLSLISSSEKHESPSVPVDRAFESSRVLQMASKLLLIGLILATTTMGMVVGVFQGSPSPNGASFNLFGIRVTLYCTPSGNTAGPGTPPFRGADVMLECGGNKIIAKGRTNDYGFSYSFANPGSVMPFLPLQSNCSVVVNTTLSNCNSTLPKAGGLRSSVKFVGTSLIRNLVVANFAPTGFRYNSSM